MLAAFNAIVFIFPHCPRCIFVVALTLAQCQYSQWAYQLYTYTTIPTKRYSFIPDDYVFFPLLSLVWLSDALSFSSALYTHFKPYVLRLNAIIQSMQVGSTQLPLYMYVICMLLLVYMYTKWSVIFIVCYYCVLWIRGKLMIYHLPKGVWNKLKKNQQFPWKMEGWRCIWAGMRILAHTIHTFGSRYNVAGH